MDCYLLQQRTHHPHIVQHTEPEKSRIIRLPWKLHLEVVWSFAVKTISHGVLRKTRQWGLSAGDMRG